MKYRRIITAMFTASFFAASLGVYAENVVRYDKNSDGQADIFDMPQMRKDGTDTAALNSFILDKPYESGYVLKWSDEFDGKSLDMEKWSYELGNWKLDDNGNYITNGWGNNEQEFYTDRNTKMTE